jgi:phosphoribosylformylglycinamidine synthase
MNYNQIKMKFGVVVFPGSNCDEDMFYTLKHLLDQDTIKLWHKDSDLQGCDFIVLPGGFSYGDYLRSGAIARFSPIMESVIKHANQGGYVLGICNGFQILTESHLLPGALLKNDNHKYVCKNVYLKPMTKHSLLTQTLDKDKAYKIPIGHGEGRFFASSAILEEIEANDQILFKYCDEAGNIIQSANPNGALNNIAGICNKARNVFGMMPHPERAADIMMGNTDGRHILESILTEVYA